MQRTQPCEMFCGDFFQQAINQIFLSATKQDFPNAVLQFQVHYFVETPSVLYWKPLRTGARLVQHLDLPGPLGPVINVKLGALSSSMSVCSLSCIHGSLHQVAYASHHTTYGFPQTLQWWLTVLEKTQTATVGEQFLRPKVTSSSFLIAISNLIYINCSIQDIKKG